MMRRATPDSEAVVSSEDEKPWPRSTNFGSLPRKENGVPGLGGGIWAQRNSFTLPDQARRVAARETRLPPTAGFSHAPNRQIPTTPSPTTSEGAKPLPFAIPLQPTAKPGRSLSHSQGQRETPTGLNQQAGGMDRTSVLPLGLLNEAEEGDTESESELGVTLTQTTSHPPTTTYQRNVPYTTRFEQQHRPPNVESNRPDAFNEALLHERLGRHFESVFGNLTLDQIPRNKQSWHTASGWDELHTINESRRHSLAGELPTRRGSLVASQEPTHDERSQQLHSNHLQLRPLSNHSSNTSASGLRALDRPESFHIPDGYRVPHVTLDPQERAEMRQSLNELPPTSRPRKMLYIVSFKCSRVGVFYLLDNTGLTVNEGDMVIVEADRGQDLGTVQHVCVAQEEARVLLQKYGEEQYKWLMMFSRNNQPGAVNPNAAVYGENNAHDVSSRPHMPTTRPPRDQLANLKPKAIKRMASHHEIRMLKEKEGNEAKAKRCCQQKVFQHHLDMEILEAEFQWDWQKLIFYYYADHYVNFKELVNDLYKLYKVRLWMSAVNPASFSPNAINQPPSGIGPGAVTNVDQYRSDFDNSYAMTYGSDPDPYGAIPPYQIGYNTYVPNYPSIPGMANSFAPVPGDGTPARPTHGHWPDASGAGSAPGGTVTAMPSNSAQFMNMGFGGGEQRGGLGQVGSLAANHFPDSPQSSTSKPGNTDNGFGHLTSMPPPRDWMANNHHNFSLSTTRSAAPGDGHVNPHQHNSSAAHARMYDIAFATGGALPGNTASPRRPAFNMPAQASFPAAQW